MPLVEPEEYFAVLRNTIQDLEDSLVSLEEDILQFEPCQLWVKKYREVHLSVKSAICVRVLGTPGNCEGKEDLLEVLKEYMTKLLDIQKIEIDPNHRFTEWFEWVDVYYDYVRKLLYEVDKDRYSPSEAKFLVKNFENIYRLNEKWEETRNDPT